MPTDLTFPEPLVAFWRERHLCTVTSLRGDGTPHVVPMGIVLDHEAGLAWGITSGRSQKAQNVRRTSLVAACQVDGRWWSTLEGRGEVLEDEESVTEAVRRYAERYRQPRENPARVALRIQLTRLLGNVGEDTTR
ncbi:MAG: TIGR03618 family F420-dependent PPOX class oxidoreductase [Nocardioides sp.]